MQNENIKPDTLTGKNKGKARREMRGKATKMVIDSSEDATALAGYDYNWADLETLRHSLRDPIDKAAGQMERIVNHHIRLYQPNEREDAIIQSALRGIKEDIAGFKNRLNNIHKNYAGKSGKIVSLQDYNIYQNAGNQYTIAFDEFRDFLLLNTTSLESVLAGMVPVQPEQDLSKLEEIVIQA